LYDPSIVRFTLAIAFSLIFIAAGVAYYRLPGTRQAGVFNIDPPTPYFHYINSGSRGRVLVVHGLDANKNLMNILCYALADAGFDVLAIDLPGHGASKVPFNAVLADETVGHILEKLGTDTIPIGHSLGGAFLLDFANDHPVKNMVLFSPAPTGIDTVMTSRLLLFDGTFELPPFRKFARQIAATAEGAAELHDLPWTGHSGALTKPGVLRTVAGWLGGDSSRIQTGKRLGLLMTMLISSLAVGILLLQGTAKETLRIVPALNGNTLVVFYIAAAFAAVALLRWIPVAAWLRMFATDYLIGFLFLTGLILCLRGFRARMSPRALTTGVAAAAYVIAIPGFLVVSEFVQISLTPERLWRFPAIFALGLPLCLADEMYLRPGPPLRAGLRFLLTRALFAAIVIWATLMWSRDASFLLLIVHIMVVFWLAVWIAGGLVYRRTQDQLATAVFASIVQAWIFAALFVTV